MIYTRIKASICKAIYKFLQTSHLAGVRSDVGRKQTVYNRITRTPLNWGMGVDAVIFANIAASIADSQVTLKTLDS